MGPENFFSSGMWIIPLVMMIICIFAFRFFLLKSNFFGKNQGNSSTDESALEILKKRYARGEISKSEFESMKKDL
jgi:putative membrane protein